MEGSFATEGSIVCTPATKTAFSYRQPVVIYNFWRCAGLGLERFDFRHWSIKKILT